MDPTFLQDIAALVMKNTGSVVKTVLGNFDVSKGEFRKTNVVAGRERFVNYDKVIPRVTELSQAIQARLHMLRTRREILRYAFDAHFELVSIHPFGDGNGRTSRLLMNYIQAFHQEILTVVFKEDKAEYIQALMDTREKADRNIFQAFMCKQHIKLLETELQNDQKSKDRDQKPSSQF